MGLFFLLAAAVLLLLAGWSWWAGRYVLAGRGGRRFALAWILYDVLLLASLLLQPAGLRSFLPSGLLLAGLLLFAAQFICNAFVSLAVLGRWLADKVRQVPYDGTRRRLLRHGLVYPAAAMGLAAYGGCWERPRTVVREMKIAVPHLTAKEGLRIAQLSDVHLGAFFSTEDWRELLERTAALSPDVLVITGDLFDDEQLNDEAAAVADSFVERFPLGIYFIFGNHEHFRGFQRIRKMLAGTRLHVLVNEGEFLPEAGLFIAGVDYPMDRAHFEEQRLAYHEQALSGAPEGVTTLLLAHHPECIDDGAASGAALTLTGHTHGCQFGILGEPLFPVFRYNRGLVRHGDAYGYVHSGNGSWFPCRIGCPPEIAVFRLVPQA